MPLAERISKELKRRGFKFAGTTHRVRVDAGVGIVNDHAMGCFRRAQVSVARLAPLFAPVARLPYQACRISFE